MKDKKAQKILKNKTMLQLFGKRPWQYIRASDDMQVPVNSKRTDVLDQALNLVTNCDGDCYGGRFFLAAYKEDRNQLHRFRMRFLMEKSGFKAMSERANKWKKK